MEQFIAVLIIFAIPIVLIVWALRRPRSGPPKVCTTCGHYGPPERITPGSIGVELVLWLLFLLPGMIYSAWRMLSRHDGCASCGAKALVSPDSPVGKKMRA